MAALDYLTKDVAGAVDRYMSVLSHIGYKSYCAVDKLLVYLFIEEILNMFLAITEEDYNIVANVINCFYGSCLIPFPYYIEEDEEEEAPPIFRISEDDILRFAEGNELRLKT